MLCEVGSIVIFSKLITKMYRVLGSTFHQIQIPYLLQNYLVHQSI